MTAAGPAQLIPFTGVPLVNKGWNGINLMMSKYYWQYLQELHWFGTEFPTVYPSDAGVTDWSTGDQSWNRRHAENVGNGATPTTTYFSCGDTSYYKMALTGGDLNTLGAGQSTTVWIAKLPNFSTFGVGPLNTAADDGWGLYRGASPGQYTFSVRYAAGADPTIITINSDADTGTVFETIAATAQYDGGVQAAHIYRIKPGGTLQTGGTMVLTAPVVSPAQIQVGRSIVAAFTGVGQIVGAMVFNHAFTGAEIFTLRGQLRTFLASRPTPIAI